MRNSMRQTYRAERFRDLSHGDLPIRQVTDSEVENGKRSYSSNGFMSWSVYDRLDSAQQYGVKMKIAERNG